MDLLESPVCRALYATLPYAVAWHTLFWVWRAWLSSVFFPKIVANMNGADQSYLAATMVSSIHAVVVVVLACGAILKLGLFNMLNDVNLSSPETALTIQVMLGYIMQDLMIALYYNTKWKGWVANLIHHMAVTMTWSICLGLNVIHPAAVFGALLELTTPFANIHWFCRAADMKDSSLFFANGWLFLISWTIFRVGFYTRCLISFMQGWADLWSLPSIGFGIPTWVTSMVICSNFFVGYVLQLMWWHRLVTGAMKALKGSVTPEAASGDSRLEGPKGPIKGDAKSK